MRLLLIQLHADNQSQQLMPAMNAALNQFLDRRRSSRRRLTLADVVSATDCHAHDIMNNTASCRRTGDHRALSTGWPIYKWGESPPSESTDESILTNGTFTRCSLKNQVCSSLVRSTSLTARSFVPSSPC